MKTFFSDLSEYELLQWIKHNKRLKTKSEIPISYTCSKCKELLVDPVQTDCGCRYCRACFHEHFDADNKVCLNDGECDNKALTGDISCDKAVSRDILRFVIKCPFVKCAFYDKVKDIKSHMELCEHLEERCIHCYYFYALCDKENHEQNQCLKRTVECKYCHITMPHDVLTREHHNVESATLCRKYEADCPYGCGLVVACDHKAVCTNHPMVCPFPDCEQLCTKATINEHLAGENYKHLSTFIETILVNDQNIAELKDTIQTKLREIERLKKTCNDIIAEMRTSQQLTLSRSLAPSVRHVEFRKGTMIWKLEKIIQLKTNAENGIDVAKLSDPFYSSEFGYKLCIKVYPAGDGIGHKFHLSVYFVVMKGEYDDLLSWPFRNKVTLSIVSLNKAVTETFKPDPTSPCYQKPISDYNVASGSPKFLKFDDLPKFIIDGSIFIKMVVLPN